MYFRNQLKSLSIFSMATKKKSRKGKASKKMVVVFLKSERFENKMLKTSESAQIIVRMFSIALKKMSRKGKASTKMIVVFLKSERFGNKMLKTSSKNFEKIELFDLLFSRQMKQILLRIKKAAQCDICFFTKYVSVADWTSASRRCRRLDSERLYFHEANQPSISRQDFTASRVFCDNGHHVGNHRVFPIHVFPCFGAENISSSSPGMFSQGDTPKSGVLHDGLPGADSEVLRN
uniref:Uncharacterized protein n=1 Tax=Panagrolaimus sp. JU765 TaxID=591449 RepID=A0AC34R051_9BILA